jgi:ketosteroid isomerase-like protein
MVHEQNHADDMAALQEMAREFAEGFNSGNVERLMRFYGDQYVDVNLRQPVQSHEERRTYFAWVMRRGLGRVQVLPDEIQVHGEFAFIRGRVVLSRPDATDLANSIMELRYLEIARKGPDGWKAYWGMDGPVQEYVPSLQAGGSQTR